MIKGTHHSKETRRKIGKAKKGNKIWLGRRHTEETKKKISKANKGKKRSEESKRRISRAMKGRKFSEEHKRKLSKAMKGNKFGLGHKHTEESKRKMSEVAKGKKRSKEFKRKMSKFAKLRVKEKNPNWRGGISFEPYSADWTETLKRSIRERDNYICQLCGKTQIEELEEIEKKLAIHHIDYDKKNCNPDNLITLCRNCNSKVNSNRKSWINYFRSLAKSY